MTTGQLMRNAAERLAPPRRASSTRGGSSATPVGDGVRARAERGRRRPATGVGAGGGRRRRSVRRRRGPGRRRRREERARRARAPERTDLTLPRRSRPAASSGSRDAGVAAERPHVAGLDRVAQRAGDDLAVGIAGDRGDIGFEADRDLGDRRARASLPRSRPARSPTSRLSRRQAVLLALLDGGSRTPHRRAASTWRRSVSRSPFQKASSTIR